MDAVPDHGLAPEIARADIAASGLGAAFDQIQFAPIALGQTPLQLWNEAQHDGILLGMP